MIFWHRKPSSSLTLPLWLSPSLKIPHFHICGTETSSPIALQPLAVPLRLFVPMLLLPIAHPLSFSSSIYSHLSVSTSFTLPQHTITFLTRDATPDFLTAVVLWDLRTVALPLDLIIPHSISDSQHLTGTVRDNPCRTSGFSFWLCYASMTTNTDSLKLWIYYFIWDLCWWENSMFYFFFQKY